MSDESNGTRVSDNPAQHRYEIEVDGTVAGFLVYRRDGDTLDLVHTEVDPGFGGRGLGSLLARGALDAIRAEGLAVRPECPFIRGYIQRNPGYTDLVPPADRATFGLAG